MKATGIRALASLLGLCALLSCGNPEVKGFAWLGAEGGRVILRERGATVSGFEGRLAADRPSRLFVLASPRAIIAGHSLELSFKPGPRAVSTKPPRVEVALSGESDGSRPFLVQTLTVGEAVDRLVLPLPPGALIRSLSLSLKVEDGGPAPTSPGADGGYEVELVALREPPLLLGIDRGADGMRISAGVSVFRKAGEEHLVVDSPALADILSPGAPSGLSGFPGVKLGILVDYGQGGGEKTLRLVTGSGQGIVARLRPQGLRTVFPVTSIGGAGPGDGGLDGSSRDGSSHDGSSHDGSSHRLELVLPPGVEFRAFSVGWLDESDAELADFGSILRASPGGTRRDYDLYRWDLLPSVLIFDFRDYAIQDSYLKRLAFFVEKLGFKGRLAPDSEIANLHGWNAHDYRPLDLAAFFEAARKTSFPLSDAELELRSLLLGRGIILEKDGAYEAGEGAIISITRESEAYLRTMFLTHESTHALFFADAAYRVFVQRSWAAMDRDEKWFWRLYFGWMNYDTGDEYLMANEYQAYLLQQTLGQTTEYFTKLLPARLAEKHEDLLPRLETYMTKYGANFEKRAAVLDEWLGAKYGFRAGRASSY